MILYPAIDLKDGHCVRLEQGDMAKATVFNADPPAQAETFARQGLRMAACRRSRRRLRRQADERRRGRGHSGQRQNPGAARRRHPRPATPSRAGSTRAWRASSSAPRRCAIPALVREAARRHPGRDRRRHRRAGRPRRGRGLGQRRRKSARSSLACASRTPASPPSSIPTSPATAILKGLNIEATLALADALDNPGHRLGRPRLARRRRAAAAARLRASSTARSPAARSMTAGSTRRRRWRLIRERPRRRRCLNPASSPASTSRTAASSRASISSICATPAIRSNAPSPMTPPAPTSSAFSTSPRATRTARILLDVVRRTAEACFMPLTVGGGVRTLDDIRTLLLAGADKVSIMTAAVQNRDFVREAAEKFGSQCIVVAIDAKQTAPGRWEIFTHGGRRPTGIDAVEYAQRGRRPRRRRDPADLDGPRRRENRLRHCSHPRGRPTPSACRSSPPAASANSIISSRASATAARPPCSPPRSSISANSPSPRPSAIWRNPDCGCGWME